MLEMFYGRAEDWTYLQRRQELVYRQREGNSTAKYRGENSSIAFGMCNKSRQSAVMSCCKVGKKDMLKKSDRVRSKWDMF